MKQKRSLGQNFFINEHLGEKIVNTILKEESEHITEIGPGDGFFTGKLHSKWKNITVIEKDDNLSQMLSYKYNNVIVYNQDFLDFDLTLLPDNTLFFGSLPYNMAKPIIKKIISSGKFTKPAFFIIQKEVAEKYIAKEPDNNLLSLLAQSYSQPQKIFDIGRDSFRPKPKVTSSLIKFLPDKKYQIPEDFELFLQKAFKQPRKTIRNNLQIKNSAEIFSKRPSELSLTEYLELFNQNLI